VEDDPDTCEIMRTVLTRAGHQPTCAPNGHEALAALTSFNPELIILDLRMPVMDGESFLKVMRSYLRWYHVPVIVVSAAEPSELERVVKFDVAQVFRKSAFDLSDLSACVDEVLKRPPRSDE
jgi:DNA-binding response OmpR family regulator